MPLNTKITSWDGRVAWVVGASSGIGRATAHELHARGATVIVSARNAAALDAFVAQHPGSIALPLDVGDAPALQAGAQQILRRHGAIDLALYCAGHYLAQRATAFNLAEMLRHQHINYVGALHLLQAVLPGMIAARSGHISLVGSVAGYRGLPRSLAYGPTKAALNNLAESLYLDLHPLGIGVSIINPGFVQTPLTQQNDFTMPALITPEQAAQHIVRGWARGRFEMHFPRRFTAWMQLLRHLPAPLYFRAVQRTTGA